MLCMSQRVTGVNTTFGELHDACNWREIIPLFQLGPVPLFGSFFVVLFVWLFLVFLFFAVTGETQKKVLSINESWLHDFGQVI